MGENQIFALFCKDVRKYPILTKEKELFLLIDYKNNKNIKSRDILFNSNLRYIITIVNQYKGLEMDKMDMVQTGSLGLLDAIETFNINSGYRLLTFAKAHIIGSIKNSFYNEESTIKKTKYTCNKIKNGDISDFNFISTSDNVLLEESLHGDCYDELFNFDIKTNEHNKDEFWSHVRKILKKDTYYNLVISMFSGETSNGKTFKISEAEIAKLFSVSKQAIGVKKHKIFNILKNDPKFTFGLSKVKNFYYTKFF